MKRVAQITLSISATLLAIGLIWVFQPTLALFGGSLAISAALRPLVQRLEKRGIGRGIAILIWYVLILAGLAVGILIYAVGIVDEISTSAEQVPRWYSATIEAWKHGSELQRTIAAHLPDFDRILRSFTSGDGLATVSGTIIGISGSAASFLLFSFAVLSLAYYWLIEVAHFERLWLSLLPVGARVRARTVWRNAETAVGAYIRTTVIAVAISALLLLALYRVVGLPFDTLFALVGGFSQLVPRLGPALALLPPALIALILLQPLQAVVVLIVGIAIQFFTHRFAVRTMQTEALKVNPLLQVLILLALAELGGFWAMIYAPPLAGLIQVLYAGIVTANTSTQPEEDMLDLLTTRLERLKSAPDAERIEVVSTLRRSDELLKQARDLLENNS
jgi:predicted PurR-regulated permease PerM